jgi:uncharacterized protein
MPRKLLRRWLPHPARIRGDRQLSRVFGAILHDGNLWHLNRYSVSWAVSVGLFMAFMPVPFQMVLAAGVAIAIRCNLPIAVVMVWASNPLTMGPMLLAAYRVGVGILGVPEVDTPPPEFEPTLAWLWEGLGVVWQPILLGSVVLGLCAAALAQLVVRLLWRLQVVLSWRERRGRAGPGERPSGGHGQG